jgi:hypothetical protein
MGRYGSRHEVLRAAMKRVGVRYSLGSQVLRSQSCGIPTPALVGQHHSVERGAQLSHAGDERECRLRPRNEKWAGEGADHRVTHCRDERCRAAHRAHARPAALCEQSPAHLAGVAGQRRNAHARCDLAAYLIANGRVAYPLVRRADSSVTALGTLDVN